MKVRKTIAIIVPAILLGIFAAQFQACEKFLLPEVLLGQDTLFFKAEADSQAVRITTNVITTADPEQLWISTDPVWFDQSSSVMVSVTENPDTTRRIGTIPIKSEAIQKTLTIIQEGRKQ